MIDPTWEGAVQFYELLFGSWLTYIFLIFYWEKILRQPLKEWRYLLLNLMGAAAFLINHYFQLAPFYGGGLGLLSLYTYAFLALWFFIGVRGHGRSIAWQVAATASAVVYTIAFICFEYIARIGVDRFGIAEFWFMLGAYLGFAGIILWTYMSFAQFTIIWHGNLGEEIIWYLDRSTPSWKCMAVVLALFHFV